MNKIYKLLSFFSTIGFLIALSWTYSYLPLKVKVMELDSIVFSYDKHNVFYSLIAVAVIYNLIFFVINSFLRSKIGTDKDRSMIQPWIDDFALLKVAIDVFFITTISFVGLHNRMDAVNLSAISFILYIGVGGLILWFVYFIYTLFTRLKAS